MKYVQQINEIRINLPNETVAALDIPDLFSAAYERAYGKNTGNRQSPVEISKCPEMHGRRTDIRSRSPRQTHRPRRRNRQARDSRPGSSGFDGQASTTRAPPRFREVRDRGRVEGPVIVGGNYTAVRGAALSGPRTGAQRRGNARSDARSGQMIFKLFLSSECYG